MIPWDKINALQNRASEWKRQGNFAEALPLREEAARLLEEHGAGAEHVANGWNYVAYVYIQIGEYGAAEQAARRSLSFYLEHSLEKNEQLASYLWMLSMALEKQGKFTEALPHLDEAVAVFVKQHGEDDFVRERQADLERIRKQIWKG